VSFTFIASIVVLMIGEALGGGDCGKSQNLIQESRLH
jgi:hypothetical protein